MKKVKEQSMEKDCSFSEYIGDHYGKNAVSDLFAYRYGYAFLPFFAAHHAGDRQAAAAKAEAHKYLFLWWKTFSFKNSDF